MFETSLKTFEYIAADQSSGEIYCKLCNYGIRRPILEKVLVNGTEVSTREPLPITIDRGLYYTTVVFKYNGNWEDTIVIGLQTEYARLMGMVAEGDIPTKVIDLQDAAENPIEGAYPSVIELITVFHRRNTGLIIQALFWGSIAYFDLAFISLVSRRPGNTSKYSQSELISRAATYLESAGYKVKTEGNLLEAVKAERGLNHFSVHNVAYWLLRKKCRITVDATLEGNFTVICQGEKAVAEAEKLSSMLKG